MSAEIKVVQVGAVGAAAAQGSAAQAQVLLNTFRGAFYGALAADPAQDPNGNTPDAGDAYFSTATGKLRVYSGAAWADYDQAAQEAAAAAAASLATLRGAFYGALAADPAEDPNGNAPGAGDAYYSTDTGKLRVYSGAAWADYDQAAQEAAAAAATSLATFRGIFYGPLAADPAEDPNGNAPGVSDLYFSTATGKLRVYDGAAWADYDQAAQEAATAAAASLATFRGTFYGALDADPVEDSNGDAVGLGDTYYSTVTGKLRVYGETGWADYDQAAQDAATRAATSEQRAADSAALASGQVSNALALYGGAGALEAAVGEAEGFALTATAQASLAATSAAAASSVAQQDLSGAVAKALHRAPGGIVGMCIDDPRTWTDGGAVLERLSGLSYQREALNGAWLGWHASEMGARCAAAAAAGTLTLGANQMAGGDFSSATGWTVNTGWSIDTVKGVAVHTPGAGTNTQLYKSAGITINKVFAITFTVRDYKAGSVAPQVGAWNTGASVSAAGTTTQYIAATHANTSSAMVFSASSDFDGSIDDVIVQEVTNLSVLSGAYYGNSGDGKFYRLWRNLFTYSEFQGGQGINAAAITGVPTALAGYAGAVQMDRPASGNCDTLKTVIFPSLGQSVTFEFVVSMDDGLGAPVFDGTVAGSDMQVFVTGTGYTAAADFTVKSMGGNLYLVSITKPVTGTNNSTGVRKATQATARNFRVTAFHIEYGNSATYEVKGADTTQTETFRGNKSSYGRTAWIAEASRVVGYAIDEPGCPMWGVWSAGNDYFINTAGGGAITSLAAINGWLVVGTSTRGFALFDFAKDTGLSGVSAALRRLIDTGGLAGVRTGLAFPAKLEAANYWTIANLQVNSVAACVMPDAPCDPTTGLQVPTIAVAVGSDNAGSVGSVIMNGGSVVNYSQPGNDGTSVAFTRRGDVMWGTSASTGLFVMPLATANVASINTAARTYGSGSPVNVGVSTRKKAVGGAILATFGRTTPDGKVTLIRENPASLNAGLSASIHSTYNTGWMAGDIRRAYLASVSAGVVSDANKVTNGDFSAGTSGWTVGANATVDTSSGAAVITATNVTDRVMMQPISVTPNVPVIIKFRASVSAGNASRVRISNSNLLSTPAVDYFDNIPTTVSTDYSYTITPTQATVYLAVIPTTDGVTTITVDNFVIADVDADRSYKGSALQVHGTLTKTAVAAGAQLVAYSGFSNTNYLQEAAPSTDLDPATGALCVPVWATVPAVLPASNFPEISGELAVNGGFDADANWAKGVGWSISGGVATHAAGQSSPINEAVGAAGRFYKVTWTVSNATAGTSYAAGGSAVSATHAGNGTFTEIVKSTGVSIGVGGNTDFNGSIDNVSIHEVGPLIAIDRSAAIGAFYRFGCWPDGTLTASLGDGTTTRTVTTTAAYNTGTRIKASLHYTTDGTLAINVNGVTVASTTGTPLGSLSNANAILTVGNSRDLNAAWPGDLCLLRIGMTVPTADASQFMYDTERQMFQPGAQVTLPDSGSVVDMDYDPLTDKLKVASAANESTFVGLQRVSSAPVSAGSITKVATKSGIKLIARSTTNPGVDITIPPQNLRESLNRRDQVRTRIPERRLFEADATASQTSFRGLLPPGWEVESVAWGALANGATLRREGAAKDWQRQFDGFVEWPVANTGLAAGTSVQVMGRRATS